MAKNIKLKKGFNINLAGAAAKQLGTTPKVVTYSVKPTDFVGMTIPKVLVAEGDHVKAGTPLFYDKKLQSVQYCAPVSGEIVAVERGAKRKLLSIRILADSEMQYEQLEKRTVSDISKITRPEAQEQMLKFGVWPQLIQRPFNIVADPEVTPRDIFISAFDSHPLAPDYDFLFKGEEKYFQAGVEVLSKFTTGSVFVNVDAESEVSPIFGPVKKAVVNQISGPHPAGCVGVQIHHIAPINKGDTVWTINPYGVIQIGKLFLEGVYDASKTIAVCGSALEKPQYFKTFSGAHVKPLVNAAAPNEENIRIISGNVLTGTRLEGEGYIGYYDHQLTVIREGNKSRFFLTEGWLAPTSRLSFHRAFGLLSFLNRNKQYTVDTNMNGEERAFVMTGAFEKVVPMDIYPSHLMKAIMAEDYESMEALGIYEVAEEDLALCEFIDVSKHEVQAIIRKGLDLMRLA